ncbi:MAG: Superfamily II DNA or RNA helicase/HKD family nuclease [Verrucomicrobia bacterium]|nr:MAG: Superfamily II DNA or RNA helicase/HKD family nuclease [Verrucomicrobiota bacterium]
MSRLVRGLHERLLTRLLEREITELESHLTATRDVLRDADAADRLALHLSRVVERAIDSLPDRDRARLGADLARRLIAELARAEGLAKADFDLEDPVSPPELLRGVRAACPDGRPEEIAEPLIPLLDTALLTNAPGEPNVGHQLLTEIASADRIDLVMAFIRRSGIRPLRDVLRRHAEAGRELRVLTTVYTGSTEGEALDLLRDLGADVRVSYDTTSTRLHAKAWLFHRESGFSTAYVGSSNLTHSAQVSGLEWNLRVSEARNRAVVEKLAAVFESYWQQPDFEAYDRERFDAATRSERPSFAVALPPTEIRLEPFQERLLEQIALARAEGRHRNLLVSATGTGKTVMAAVDYARLRRTLPRSRLLFIAHRNEILTQAQSTFAIALRDPSFGERWVGGDRPSRWDQVFASIQSLDANSLESLDPAHFDVVIVDEFHHAAASSYERVLAHLQPLELLGLTATPERSDGLPILHWFGNRIAAELRLWDAIDQHRLVPFAYYGVTDSLDLRDIPWTRSRGYDTAALTGVITTTDVWARQVLGQCVDYLGPLNAVRALGFCVSVEHARYMARVFAQHRVAARAVDGNTPIEERREVLQALASGTVNVVFSVDLFNEGVDVPSVDTLLMLRPTDSPLLFVQQLGRGLRRASGKAICTVLDFVGQHRREFRFDRRLGGLLGGTRRQIEQQVKLGFPFLPAGCQMQLERVARERILESIRGNLLWRRAERAQELAALVAQNGEATLGDYLRESGLELEELYAQPSDSWTALREMAGLPVAPEGPHETALRRAIGRLLHVDDRERLDAWRRWLRGSVDLDLESERREAVLVRMLLCQVLEQVADGALTFSAGADLLKAHPAVCRELIELSDVLAGRVAHLSSPLADHPSVPLRIHARYTRREILVASRVGTGVRGRPWREGVLHAEHLPADLFVFTLDKTDGQFSPTTRYRDYAISRHLIHWESQSTTRAGSPTGRRYQQHVARGSQVWIFARLRAEERAFTFLGPATYVSHVGEAPMAITWRLQEPLPGDLFQTFAAAVA